MSFIENLKEAVGFQILKLKEENLLALEVVPHGYSKDKKAVKGLNLLTSISVAKAYYHLFGVNHKVCYCWCCRIREVCFKILMEQKTDLIVLTTLYKVFEMPEKNIYPFFEEWIIKNKQ